MTQNDNRAKPLRVVDFGHGMAAALISQMLANLGARVVRPESATADPFDTIYPAHRIWREKAVYAAESSLDAELQDADVCLLGGESHPDLAPALDTDDIAVKYPHLVVLRLDGFVSAERRDAPANDVIAQALTGLCFEQYTSRPALFACPAPTYGATLLGLIGVFAALIEREESGLGQIVATSLEQGAAMWMEGGWTESVNRDFLVGGEAPKDIHSPVYRCADGNYVVTLFGVPGSVAGTYRALDIDLPVDPRDRGLPDISRGTRDYYAKRDILEPAFARFTRDDALAGLWKEQIPADAVLAPGECWDSEQVQANGLVERASSGWKSVALPIRNDWVGRAADSANAPRANFAEKAGPLAGIRIVDFGAFVAGPFSGKLLSDLGADVIKVEPLTGDPMRGIERPFAGVSRGKRSIALDLKKADDLETFREICGASDVVVHNLRVGVAERLGVDPASLRARNPGLIVAHASAFGPEGPKSLNSGFDPILQGWAGHAVRMGGQGNAPEMYKVPLLDYGVGALTAAAVLHAILERRRSGSAADIHTSLLGVGLYLLSELVESPDGERLGAPVANKSQTGLGSVRNLFATSDGWVAVVVRSDDMARALAVLLGIELPPLSQWADREADTIAEAVRQRSSKSLVDDLQSAGVWAVECCTDGLAALQVSPSARDAGLCVEGPHRSLGTVVAVGPLIRFSRTDVEISLPKVSEIGADSDDILREMARIQDAACPADAKR